eukprot:16441619-Heterocapsa_arctica.AAC.1
MSARGCTDGSGGNSHAHERLVALDRDRVGAHDVHGLRGEARRDRPQGPMHARLRRALHCRRQQFAREARPKRRHCAASA